MTSIERVLAALNFQQEDRTPVIAPVFGHAAVFSGVPLGEYLRDGEQIARCQIRAWEHYGYDSVFALMDTSVEAEALGGTLRYREDLYPYIESYAFEGQVNLDTAVVPDPLEAGRMPELLKAARLLRAEVGDEVVVIGCILGPMTVATQSMGAEKALYLAIDAPEVFARLLDFTTEIGICFGRAQLEAGVHLPVVFDPSASPAVVPEAFYREIILPRHQRLFSELDKAGTAAKWLHIAGPVDGILKYYPQAGVNLANFDYCVTAETVQRELPKTCVDGNVRPLEFVDSDPEKIAADSEALLEQFVDRKGFILAAGCEIPPEAGPENIEAMVQSTRVKV